MKGIAVLANIVLRGVGTMMMGKAGAGIAQLAIWGFGFMFTLGTLGFGAIIGLPMMLGTWIWAIVSAASEPQTVTVIHKNE